MKIRLSELRRIIRETVEQEMGSKLITPITAADYELLQQNGFSPVLGRMRGAIEDRIRKNNFKTVPVDDPELTHHIADFDDVVKPDIMRRKPNLAEQITNITGERVAAYLINKVQTDYNTAPGKPVSPFGPQDPTWDPDTRTHRFGTN